MRGRRGFLLFAIESALIYEINHHTKRKLSPAMLYALSGQILIQQSVRPKYTTRRANAHKSRTGGAKQFKTDRRHRRLHHQAKQTQILTGGARCKCCRD